jgi:hypothetical protein
VARSGQSDTERLEKFSVDEAEKEDADASLHWTHGDFTGHTETTSLALMLKDNVPVNAHLDFINS